MKARDIDSYIADSSAGGKSRQEILEGLLSQGASEGMALSRIRKHPDPAEVRSVKVLHRVLLVMLAIPCFGSVYSMIDGGAQRFAQQWPILFYFFLLYGVFRHWRGAYLTTMAFFGLVAALMGVAVVMDLIDGLPFVATFPYSLTFVSCAAIILLSLKIYRRLYSRFEPDKSGEARMGADDSL